MNKTFVIGLFLLISNAFSVEYMVNKEADNQVIFNSDAPVLKIQGITNNINGYVVWEGTNPFVKNELYFEVDLNTLDTGNKRRNQQMRENFLDTNQFQYAFFRGAIETIDTLEVDKLYNVKLNGMLNVHGVEKPYKIEGEVTRDNDEMQIESFFEIVLQEHNIKVPKFLFVKLSPILQIELTFYLQKKE